MKKFWNKEDRKGRSFAKPLGRIAAKIAGGGGAAGATTGLAAAFGTASTGTAISSLSGAAAMNATLAWLGGGAIAVGGFGMIGGAAVLTAVGVGGAYGAQKLYDYVVK